MSSPSDYGKEACSSVSACKTKEKNPANLAQVGGLLKQAVMGFLFTRGSKL